MSDPLTDSGVDEVRVHQVHDLMMALFRFVLWPFRWRVGVILIMQMVSQIMLVASLLLPWQLLQVLLTGHNRIEGLVSGAEGSNDEITLLIMLTAICFCSYALLKWWIKKAIVDLSEAIFKRLNKTRMVNNHRLLGRRVLSVVISALSSILIAVLFILLIAMLHQLLAFLAVMFVFFLVGWLRFFYCFERVNKIQQTLQNNVLTLINIGFVLSFSIIFLDYLHDAMRPFLVLFVLLLSMRQLMASSVNALVNFLSIIKRFQQINMLLLPRSQQIALPSATSFTQRFEQAAIAHWLLPWLTGRQYIIGNPVVCQCRLLHGRGVAQVIIQHDGGEKAPRYLLFKCYIPARENEALHEAALLNAVGSYHHSGSSSIPELIENGRFSWCCFLLLTVGNKRPQWKNAEERKPWMGKLRQDFCNISLPNNLVGQFAATFPSLPERMRELAMTRFNYLVQQDRDSFQVDRLIRLWPLMLAEVEKVPGFLAIQNPASARLASMDDQILLMDWQGWVFDTLGAYWPLSANIHTEAYELIATHWQDPESRQCWLQFGTPAMAAHYVALAARAHEFCQRYRNLNDAGALNMINGLLLAFEAIVNSDTDTTP
ncbi:ABC transporter ATP-binding protein [Kushneria aurantia]|uniref:ABC transporter ATP-binding protein n=1 Tax=Kushneria aurantia TaxID=504092 RepID=A0ABV6G6K4_9GAMM|nr:ABC transporter ATP-binding protein [Kushneria aurantia]